MSTTQVVLLVSETTSVTSRVTAEWTRPVRHTILDAQTDTQHGRNYHSRPTVSVLLCPRPRGHFGIARSVRLSVPWRICLGYRHAGCLQLSHRRPPQMCGLRTRPRTDVDPPRFLDRTAIGGAYRLAAPGRYLIIIIIINRFV